MDFSGIVIAASEVIRFENGFGLILTVCYTYTNFYFYILVRDRLIKSWRKILVNRCYNFFNLKLGVIELLSGTKITALIATSSSEFQEVVEHDLKKIDVSSILLKIIGIPAVTFVCEGSLPRLISYQGVITKVKSAILGLYEIDNKIHLYCILNSSVLPILEVDLAVFVSNAHFFIDFMDRKILVCCGLSSVRALNTEEKCVSSTTSLNLCHLSIFDVIWLEMLLMKLNMMFHSSVISSNYSFNWENGILINKILEYFAIKPKETLSRRKSVGEEYCSNPHLCDVFCDDILPTGCKVLQISEFLDKSSSQISWTEISSSWKTCAVKNEEKYILIGMLYLSKDGSWYIMDKSSEIPVIFTQRCSQCTSSDDVLCLFNDLNIGYLTVLQNFYIMHEKIKFNSNSYNCYRYLRTVCCYPFYLERFYKKKDNLFYLFPVEEFSPLKTLQCSSIDEITNLLENTHLQKQDTLTDVKENFNSCFNEDLNNNFSSQYFLVLNKIWSISDQVFVCYQSLVLLLPQEEIFKEYLDKSKSLFQDTSNFYETDDDYDFAELVNQMDSLFLEDKPRLARLHFESAKQCALLLPGHIYSSNFSHIFNLGSKCFVSSDKNSLKPILIKVKANMKMLHHQECLGNHSPDDYNINVYCGIKEIISERKVRENSLIKAVLKDKYYEECHNSRSSVTETNVDKTFCMLLKDSVFDDTMKVYLPFCPKNLYGFVPGVQLQMYGFVCICSKKGYFYLKPSSSFGIQTLHFESLHFRDISMDSLLDDIYSEENLRIVSLRNAQAGTFFKCMCFIVKIVSVKLNLSCNNCGKDLAQKCLCFCNYSVKLTMSFIVDDGTNQILVYSSDEAARKVLMLDVKELQKLSSFVTETKTNLTFYYKVAEEAIYSSVTENTFSAYCSSKSLCRQVFIKCKKKSNGIRIDEQAVWCYDVLKIKEVDLIPEYLAELGKIKM